MSARLRLTKLQAWRLRETENAPSLLREALRDKSPEVRLFAVRWIADERITALRDDVVRLLDGPQPNPRYYLAVLAAVDWLDHEPSLRGAGINDRLLVRELRNEQRSPELHALALRMLSPNDEFLTLERLRDYLQADHATLRLEAARSLAQQSNPARFELLAHVAADKAQHLDIRAEALVGLAAAAEAHRPLLEQLAASRQRVLRKEAQRMLRLSGLEPLPAKTKPSADDLAAWEALLETPGNAASGRRLFFSPVGARCAVCHQHGGRGGRIGPDLTNIGASNSRRQIITSILQPSQEMAPHYQPWLLVTDGGKTHTGLRLPKAGDDGIELYVDAAGEKFSLPSASIEARDASTTSIMPDGLQTTLSIDDLRGLLTFLLTSADEGRD